MTLVLSALILLENFVLDKFRLKYYVLLGSSQIIFDKPSIIISLLQNNIVNVIRYILEFKSKGSNRV